MLQRDVSFKTRYKHWKFWSTRNRNGKLYQILVLFGILYSPSFEIMFLPSYSHKRR